MTDPLCPFSSVLVLPAEPRTDPGFVADITVRARQIACKSHRETQPDKKDLKAWWVVRQARPGIAYGQFLLCAKGPSNIYCVQVSPTDLKEYGKKASRCPHPQGSSGQQMYSVDPFPRWLSASSFSFLGPSRAEGSVCSKVFMRHGAALLGDWLCAGALRPSAGPWRVLSQPYSAVSCVLPKSRPASL